VLAFLVLWWAWLGHTFHASRFDEDRADQRALGMAQILAVVLIGYGGADALGPRGWAFAAGMASFKVLLALAYLREWRRPYARGLVRVYVSVYVLQAALWAAALPAVGSLRLGGWVAALLVDVTTPFLVARHTHSVSPHPEHLPERFGLFTIILLGESVAAAIHGLDHAEPLRAESVTVVLSASALAFLFWIGYFERARGAAERGVTDVVAGRRLRLWAYGHIPLYVGVAGVAAGTAALAGHPDTHGGEPWFFAGAAALAMAGVTTVAVSNGSDDVARLARPHYLIALATAGMPLLLPGWTVVPACAAAAVAQVALAASLARLRGHQQQREVGRDASSLL
jgi:low temperature requirement protein LtrA